MADIRLKYIGAEERYSEVAITGKQQLWLRNSSSAVSSDDASLLLATGKFEQVKTGEMGTTQDLATGGPQGALDAASSAALAASGVIPLPNYIQLTGVLATDSITEGQIVRSPLDTAMSGMYQTNLSPESTTPFLKNANCDSVCGATDAVNVVFDGVKYAKVAIAGDSFGPLVDISGGGYFTLFSGTNGKKLHIGIRWANMAAQGYVGTGFNYNLTNSGSIAHKRHVVHELWLGALAKAKMMHHRILNYGMGGDNTTDLLNRLPQIRELKADWCGLMMGVNNSDKSIIDQDYITAIEALIADGTFVFAVLTLPIGFSAGDSVAWSKSLNALRRKFRTSYRGKALLVDAGSFMVNPQGSNGAGLIYSKYYNTVDQVHPNIIATLGQLATNLAAALLSRYPQAGYSKSVSGADAYNATTNPFGNLIGVRAGMAGTGGTKGITPTATGTVPDNWVEEVAGANAYTSVACTAPGDASPIARDDGGPGNVFRIVVAGANAAGSSRRVYCNLENALVAGNTYRLGIKIRLQNCLNLTSFDIYISGAGCAPSALTLAAAPPTGQTLVDSGWLYLVTQPFKLPPGTYAAPRLYIAYGHSSGGGMTLDMCDPFVEPA